MQGKPRNVAATFPLQLRYKKTNTVWGEGAVLLGVLTCFIFFLTDFLKNIYLFIYLFVAALGLHCCTRAFSSCGKRASHCGGFSCCGSWALGVQASVVVACGLSSCGSRALEHRLSSRGARA